MYCKCTMGEEGAMMGFTGGGGHGGDSEMKLRPAGQTLAGKKNQ